MRSHCLLILWISLVGIGTLGSPNWAAEYRIVDQVELDTVPSWFPVGFSLLTNDQDQYVAYYNEKHQMVVAHRKLTHRDWQKMILPSKIGWDSHNYLTMTLDTDGQLHLAGNMHCVPLVYFRTQEPGNIATLKKCEMTGRDEQRCTYPRFLNDADGNLLFTYRSGSSGNGRRFYNIYDVTSQKWSRFLDCPLFDGEGQRNAYPQGPLKGPDGRFHVLWVWRDTPDCATNHHLSYARSSDLKHWETATGQPVSLPLTLEQSELCVDPIPPGGGIINGCERLTFDSSNRPLICYHKRDENDHMQVFAAHFRNGEWQRYPLTTWDKKIDFSGGGAMPFIGIRISGLRHIGGDEFRITYRHRDYGSGRIVWNVESQQTVERSVVIPRSYPRELTRPTIDFNGVGVRLQEDSGSTGTETRFVLRWEALGAHHDRPRQPPLPPASTLNVVRLERE
jgi:hypothetical protein